MPVTFRPLGPDEFESFLAVTERAFGGDVHPDDASRERQVFEPERSLAAVDGGQVVATAAMFTFAMTVPGGPAPVAGVTSVGVLPAHRRRGLLTGLMDRQLRGLHDEGREPAAALWASEASIYGRFGYGLASITYEVTVHRGEGGLPAGAHEPRLRAAAPEEVREHLGRVYQAAAPDRPGFFARDDRWWDYRLADPDHRRGPWARRLAVVAADPAGPVGYALYRPRLEFTDGLAAGQVQVEEVVATTLPGQLALWRFLLGLDLMATVRATVAADDPVLLLLADPRRARPARRDNLWVRLVDVDRALAARRYAVDVDVVVEVSDARCRWNARRWRLAGGPHGATCSATDDRADLACDVQALGAAYLGGTSLSALAVAGLVEERTPGALAVTSAAFGAARAAYCPMVF